MGIGCEWLTVGFVCIKQERKEERDERKKIGRVEKVRRPGCSLEASSCEVRGGRMAGKRMDLQPHTPTDGSLHLSFSRQTDPT